MIYLQWTLWVLAAGISLLSVTLGVSMYFNSERKPKRYVVKRSIKWCAWVVAPVYLIGIGVIALWGGHSPPDPRNYVALKVLEAFYYDPESLERVIPDPSVGPIIPTDPQSQHDLFRVFKYRNKPVLRIEASNSHPSRAMVIQGIYFRLDNQQFWWKIGTEVSMGESERIEIPANSSVSIEGTPWEWPYAVDTGETFEWATDLSMEARQAFLSLDITWQPTELWARVGAFVSAIDQEETKFIVSPEGTRINKQNRRQYEDQS